MDTCHPLDAPATTAERRMIMQCNQICRWNDPSDGCIKPMHAICRMSNIASKKQTNADRIRAMSDDELADNWMRDFVVCHRCAYRYECECDEYVTYEKCKEGIVEWLKQPVEE